MEDELDNFFLDHEKSIKEKNKLLIDFQEESLESNVIVTLSKMEITPKYKKDVKQQKTIVKTSIVDLRKKTKNNLF